MKAMDARSIVKICILAFSIFAFRATSLFIPWLMDQASGLSPENRVPLVPSFYVDGVRNHFAARTLMTNRMRREGTRFTYSDPRENAPSLPQPVEKYLDVFTSSGKADFRKGLKNAARYYSMLDPVLKQYGLPTEMLFLAYIESGFDQGARSYADAVGPWQFMEGTARKYGLRVDETVDERTDFLKSTHAAAKYLKELYVEFGSLELALAAYNSGENRVRTAIRYGGTDDFWTLASDGFFPHQTVDHVAKFSAAMVLCEQVQ
jgi:hypothetical protein